MSSSITYLSFPSPKKAVRHGEELLQQRLDRLRRKRLHNRSRRRRTTRIAHANAATMHPTSAIVHRASRMLRAVFKIRRNTFVTRATAPLTLLLADLKNAVVRMRAFAALGRAIRSVLERLRTLVPTKLRVSLTRLTRTKSRRRHVLRVLFYCTAVTSALAARIRRLDRRRAFVPQVASAFVTTTIEKSVAACIERTLAQQSINRQKTHVASIHRAWIMWRNRRNDSLRCKQKFMVLLSSAQSDLQHAEVLSRLVQSVTTRLTAAVVSNINLELTRRRAAGLIQRVWRGWCARVRVDRLLSAKKQKSFQRLQRERVRRARAVLLSGTSQEVVHQNTVAMRVAARQNTITPLRYADAGRRTLAQCRDSILEPITRHYPPTYSPVTGARVLPVTVAKFKKIREYGTRVNPRNLWVAVPVAYNEVQTVNGGNSSASSVLKATFDWVPATLLSRRKDNRFGHVTQN